MLKKPSEILKDIEKQVADLEFGNIDRTMQLARLADERDSMSRKAREY